MNICVYGAASPTIDRRFTEKGEELGRAIAENGHTLVFGGGALGLMGAAANGVREKNGQLIGVVPRFFEHDAAETLCNFCTEYIGTDTMRERKQIMEERADAFVITPGGIGTWEEFLEILTLRQLCRHNKPIAIFNIDGYYNTLLQALREAVDKGFVKHTCLELFLVTEDVHALLTYLETDARQTGTVKTYKDG